MKTQRDVPTRIALFGANSDIATAVARRYAERGARIALVGRSHEALVASSDDLKVRGASDIAIVTADFSQSRDLSECATSAWNAFGGLDVALVAYGSLPDQQAAQTDLAEAERALNLNFTSPALLCGELARLFDAQRSGTIAVISSVAGDRGRQSNYVYGAAKGGLQRFLEGLRHRLFKAGVHVLDIRPGFVSTKMTAHLPQKGLLWATPDKVAADIMGAIDRKRAVLYAPWFWRWIMLVVRNVPVRLFHRSSL
jgi:decaprenylphospho-beta-D-erythro-pentofuranosid-2-ulose 2-reductase